MSDRSPAHALIVVDLQRGLLEGPEAVPDAASVLVAATTLLDAAREAGALVVHLQNDGAVGAPDEPGTPGWELWQVPRPGEPVLRKTADDPFAETDLESVLRQADARRVVVCGLLAEMCVAATARGALSRGFEVVLPRDARATSDIPDQGPAAPGVRAELVARVAEWSLGDDVVLVDRADGVCFSAG